MSIFDRRSGDVAAIGIKSNGEPKISAEVSRSGRHATIPMAHYHPQYATKLYVYTLGGALAAALAAAGWFVFSWGMDTKAQAVETVTKAALDAHAEVHKAIDSRIDFQERILKDIQDDVHQQKEAARADYIHRGAVEAAAKLKTEDPRPAPGLAGPGGGGSLVPLAAPASAPGGKVPGGRP